MKSVHKQFSLLILTFFFSWFLSACSSGSGNTVNTVNTPNNTLSGAKAITSYALVTPLGLANGTIKDHNIYVTIPYGTTTALAARYTTTGKTVWVRRRYGLTPQDNGITKNNFRYPVLYIVTAEDGSKESYTVTVNFDKHYAYVFAPEANKIYMNQYQVSTGIMQPLSESYINIESGSASIVLDPLKRYLLLTGSQGKFTVYPVNRETGMLESGIVSTYIYPPASVAQLSTISRSGKYVYQILSDNNTGISRLSSFVVNRNWEITKNKHELNLSGKKFDLKFSSFGQYAYLSSYNLNGISIYTLDTNGGFSNLPVNTTMPINSDANNIAMDPFDRYVYVSSYSGQKIAMYKMNESNGILTPLDNPYITANITESSTMAMGKLGKYLYLSCGNQENTPYICTYAINQKTGILSLINQLKLQLPIHSMLISPSGKYMYVTFFDTSTIYTYNIDTNGKLHYIDSKNYNSGNASLAIAIN